MEREPVSRGDSRRALTALAPGALFLVCATLLAYYPAWHGGFIWDDLTNILESPTKRDAAGLLRTWTDIFANQQYYPITHTFFWIEYQLFGTATFGYHAVNLVLHGAGAFLLWRFLAALALPGAFLAAALFALHPLQAESVAWITELKNVLSGLFCFATLWAFALWLPAPDGTTGPGRPRRRAYALALLCFTAALLSKTAVSPLPAVLAILLWWRRDRLEPREFLPLWPFFVLGLAGAGMAAFVERHHVGAGGAEFPWSFPERLIMAGKSFWFYPWKLAWPAGLTFIFPRWDIATGNPANYLPAAAALAVPFGLWLARGRLGKGLLAGYLCYAALILPILGFVDFFFLRYGFVQLHFQYLAGVGLIVPFAAELQRRCAGKAAALPLLLLLPLGALTWREAGLFTDAETLWNSVLTRNSESELAHNNLGVILQRRGRTVEALAHYEEALRLNPSSCEAEYNVGAILFGQRRSAEAIGHFERALAACPQDDDSLELFARAAEGLGRNAEAEAGYRRLLARRPDLPAARLGLGRILALTGRPGESLPHLEHYVNARPDDLLGRFALATVLEGMGRTGEAIRHYRILVEKSPGFTPARERLETLARGGGGN